MLSVVINPYGYSPATSRQSIQTSDATKLLWLTPYLIYQHSNSEMQVPSAEQLTMISHANVNATSKIDSHVEHEFRVYTSAALVKASVN